jgi:aminodeoxychorismate lyase
MKPAVSALAVWLNGQFVPAEEARVSVFDRSFLYGDGLFETIRVYRNRPFLWPEHLTRLHAGAAVLRLHVPFNDSELTAAATELLQRNAQPESLLRLHLSRGVGRRGYSIQGADSPTLVLTQHPVTAPDPAHPLRWRLITSSFQLLVGDPLAAAKTANKLVQILAKSEAEDRGADEALLLNSAGHLAEASSSNLFWFEGETLCTPPLHAGLLAGVTRAFVLSLAHALGLETQERTATTGSLTAAAGVFLTTSSLELVPAVSLDGTPLRESPHTRRLHMAYQQFVAHGTP